MNTRPVIQNATGLTLVCVYNDENMLRDCLLTSVSGVSPDKIQLILQDNRGKRFTAAGAAFNDALASAAHDVVAFVQQDVYSHDPALLLAAANRVRRDRGIGLLGAVGPCPGGLSGVIRDRLMLIGESAPEPQSVDSVDEVILLAPNSPDRRRLWTEDPDFAWHLYGAEFGLRCRRDGLRVVANDLGITHHSRSTNLDRLDRAHQRLAAEFADQLPVRTTTGVIGPTPVDPLRVRIRSLGGRARRAIARRVSPDRAAAHIEAAPFGDVREELDAWIGEGPVRVLNLDVTGSFAASSGSAVSLYRADREMIFEAFESFERLRAAWYGSFPAAAVATNLTPDQALALRYGAPVDLRTIGRTVWVVRGLRSPT